MDLSHIAFANSSRSTPGLLDLTFPNICSPSASTQYIVRTIFSACENPAIQLTSMDTITINLTGSLNATASATNTSCGPPSGTVTVNVPASAIPPFSYVLDGGAPVISPAFTHTFINVAQGLHTVVVTGGNNSCSGSINVTVNRTNALNATASSTGSTACGRGGTITVTPVNGSAPYNFSLDGGSPQISAVPFTFSNVAAGVHNIIVTDANGCTASVTATITQPAQLLASETHTAIACNGGSSTVTISATGGVAPYTGTGTFSRTAGTFTFTVTDATGCTATTSATITQPTPLVASSSASACVAGTSTVTVSASGGTAPYTGTGTFARTAGTYTFTVTDANGCTAITQVVVNCAVGCNITLSTVVTNVSCNGGSNGAINLTVNGASGTVGFNWSNGATTQNISGLTAGTYTLTVTDANNCTASTSATVTQPTPPVASQTHTNIACNGGSSIVTISASGGTAPYSGTGTFSRTAGTFTFTVTDANGCTATTSATITQPTPLVASSSASACVAGTSTVTVSASGGTTPYTGTGTFARTAGTYTFTVTDANGCTATTQVVVNCAVSCNITLSTVVTNVSCNGGRNGAINLTVNGASGIVSFNWSNGATTQNISGLTAGTYSLTVTDANSCTASTSATVTQPTPLVASQIHTNIACNGGSSIVTISATGGTAPYTGTGTFSRTAGTFTFIINDVNGCTDSVTTTIAQSTVLTGTATSTPVTAIGGSDGTATVTSSGGTSPYTYLWGPGGQTTQTATGLTTGTYTVTVTDSQGCTTTASTTVGSPGCNMSLSFTKTDVSCFGGSNGTAIVTATGASGTFSYAWSNGQTTQTATGLAAGSYSVAVNDAVGCVASGSVTVTQPTQLLASETHTVITCNGGSSIVTISASGGTAPYTGTGTFSRPAGTFTFIVTDNNGCTDSVTTTITQPAVLTGTATFTPVTAIGGSDGTATVTASGGTSPYTYLWDPGGQTTQTATGLATGTYIVTVTDSQGCTATASTTVSSPGCNMSLSFTKTDVSCFGGSNGTAIVTATGASGTFSYAWSNGQTTQTATGLAAGSYSVTVTDGIGCAASGSVTITQPAVLTASSVNINASCDGGNDGTMNLTANGGNGGYQYSLDGMQFQTSNVFKTAPGDHIVTVKDNLACMTTFNSTVGLNNDLHVSVLPHDTASYPGDKFQLTATSAATIYTWLPATGLSNPNVPNPVVTVGALGEDVTYRVTASTPEGCKGESYVRIKAYKGSDIYVPTGFTPNHDGKNDKFTPLPVGIKKINYFRVFNRWGQMVFSSTTLNEGWDGKLGGVEQPGGVFVWMVQGITIDNRVITKKGTVVLIR
jgi:gliding motility-associated-like protein